jgi:NADH-quinone oxidoreductase subunit H
VLWFLVKLFVMVYVLVWVRATLPRFRYDKLMYLGWKVLIPAGLLWILITAAYVVLPSVQGDANAAWLIGAGIAAVATIVGPTLLGRPRHLQAQGERGVEP